MVIIKRNQSGSVSPTLDPENIATRIIRKWIMFSIRLSVSYYRPAINESKPLIHGVKPMLPSTDNPDNPWRWSLVLDNLILSEVAPPARSWSQLAV